MEKMTSIHDPEDLASFNELLLYEDDKICNEGGGGCALFEGWEGLITTVFAFPSLRIRKGCLSGNDLLSDLLPDDNSLAQADYSHSTKNSSPSSTRAVQVCRLWRRKRREKDQKAIAHAQLRRDSPWTDREIQCGVKQEAQFIQRDFEDRHPRSTNQDADHHRYIYEKYGRQFCRSGWNISESNGRARRDAARLSE
jgi:hypothetical protein